MASTRCFLRCSGTYSSGGTSRSNRPILYLMAISQLEAELKYNSFVGSIIDSRANSLNAAAFSAIQIKATVSSSNLTSWPPWLYFLSNESSKSSGRGSKKESGTLAKPAPRPSGLGSLDTFGSGTISAIGLFSSQRMILSPSFRSAMCSSKCSAPSRNSRIVVAICDSALSSVAASLYETTREAQDVLAPPRYLRHDRTRPLVFLR